MADDLTPGERLWAWRHIKGYNIREAARRLKIGRNRYGGWELGVEDAPAPPADAPRLTSQLELPLRLRLARRRLGLSLMGAAERMGCSHVSLLKREKRGDPDTVAFYRRLGCKFV